MDDYYPPGGSELPGDKDVEKEYVFEVLGEITVLATSEKDAEHWKETEMEMHLYDAYKRGDIKVKQKRHLGKGVKEKN